MESGALLNESIFVLVSTGFVNYCFLQRFVLKACTFCFSFLFCGVSQTWPCFRVEGKSCKIPTVPFAELTCSVFFTEVFFIVDIIDLVLFGQDGVTFDRGLGTSSNVGIAFQMSLFFVSLFMN